MSTTMSHAHSEHAPDQTQRQPQPQSRRSSSSSRSRARGLPSPRALLAAVAGVALLGMAGGLPSAAAALPGGRPAPRRVRVLWFCRLCVCFWVAGGGVRCMTFMPRA